MNKQNFLIVGSGGREAAFAKKLFAETTLFAFASHQNPTIAHCVTKSGGEIIVGDVNNPQAVADFAVKNTIDYAFVSADDPLANGVVDELLARGIKAVGGTQAATRIEWDKVYSIEIMQEVCPQFNPFYKVVANASEINSAINEFKNQNMQVVVKPQGLTGGKGVKVMPYHLQDYDDCINYAKELLEKAPSEKVLLVEKLEGVEFTIMGLTDGKSLVLAPASYDYPFRFEGDTGPGTGGMGCWTNSEIKLPFMSDKDLDDCQTIMQKVIDKMANDKLNFSGVLNGGFFKTKDGIKFMEFNGRFGDPEGLNIMSVLDSSLADMIRDMYHKQLSSEKVKFKNQASVVKYLVAKEYPAPSDTASTVVIDEKAIENMGVDIIFASIIKDGENYQTLKKSRALALIATDESIEKAADKVNQAIDNFVDTDLEYRKDIGSKQNLQTIEMFD